MPLVGFQKHNLYPFVEKPREAAVVLEDFGPMKPPADQFLCPNHRSRKQVFAC